jgi:hypothetical protein
VSVPLHVSPELILSAARAQGQRELSVSFPSHFVSLA